MDIEGSDHRRDDVSREAGRTIPLLTRDQSLVVPDNGDELVQRENEEAQSHICGVLPPRDGL